MQNNKNRKKVKNAKKKMPNETGEFGKMKTKTREKLNSKRNGGKLSRKKKRNN